MSGKFSRLSDDTTLKLYRFGIHHPEHLTLRPAGTQKRGTHINSLQQKSDQGPVGAGSQYWLRPAHPPKGFTNVSSMTDVVRGGKERNSNPSRTLVGIDGEVDDILASCLAKLGLSLN